MSRRFVEPVLIYQHQPQQPMRLRRFRPNIECHANFAFRGHQVAILKTGLRQQKSQLRACCGWLDFERKLLENNSRRTRIALSQQCVDCGERFAQLRRHGPLPAVGRAPASIAV
ncbi:MAG: hypothetical protein ABI831_01845 [Betaproteobacteria bacterium]